MAQNNGVRYEGIDESTWHTKTYFGVNWRDMESWLWWWRTVSCLLVLAGQTNGGCHGRLWANHYGAPKVGYKDDQWVLARCCVQVAYWPMPKESKKYVVVFGKQRIVGADGV
jgi:hypothetical protein